MKRSHIGLALGMFAVATFAAALAYSQLPERIPTHWGLNGKPNGWGGRWTIFLMPGTMLLMLGLFVVLPKLSPTDFATERFESTYSWIAVIVIAMFGYMHAVMLFNYLVHPVDIGRGFTGGIFLFFALMGNVMGRVRRNFWMGIRVPWTLASERVWNDTHRVSGRLFVVSGILGCLATTAGLPILTVLVPAIITCCFVPIVYSLIEYKQLQARGEA